jgi:toxin ParE1/3/4
LGRDAFRRAARRRPTQGARIEVVTLVWSVFALAGRDDIFKHFEAETLLVTAKIDKRIAASARRLVEFPESGRPGRVAGARELVITGTPYVAAYAVTPSSIRILRVLHGAQKWLEELSVG